DPLAARLATARMDAHAEAVGRGIVAKGKSMVQARDAVGVLQADIDFHTWIYRLSGNPIIVTTMDRNWRHLRRSMTEVLQSPGKSLQVWIEHENILEAMTEGKRELAAELVLRHILDAPHRIDLIDGNVTS